MRLLLFFLLITSCLISTAQINENAIGYYDYALRYASTNNFGSPRMNALGGASTALGGDYSQHHINPAGLGLYQKNDIGFSFGNDVNQFTNEYNSSNQNQFNINSLGAVISSTEFDSKWKNHALALSFNRLGSFTKPLEYTKNQSKSLRNFIVNTAEGIDYTSLENQLDENNEVSDLLGLAYHTFLLNEKDQTNNPKSYFTFSPNENNIVSEHIKHNHRNMQYNFSYGAGIEDTYYYGISFGFRSVHEYKKREYSEIPENGDLKKITLNETETTKGVGANLTFGFMYRPINALKIGFSYQTPTQLTLNETYRASLTAIYNHYQLPNGKFLDTENAKTSSFATNYMLKIPSITRFGIAYIIKKKLLISYDLKFSRFNNLALSSTEFNLEADNNTIKNNYRPSFTNALGIEYKNKKSYLRAGININNNPINHRKPLHRHSIGVGQYLNKGIFLDLTYAHQQLPSENYRPYPNTTTIHTTSTRNSIQAGLHFIFE